VVEKVGAAEKRGKVAEINEGVAGIGQEVAEISGNVAEKRTHKKPLPNIQQWSH